MPFCCANLSIKTLFYALSLKKPLESGKNYKILAYTDKDGTAHAKENKGDTSKRILGWGNGSKINLQDGRFDVYNLYLTSKNIYLDSTFGTNTYFIIKSDEGNNLLYVGNNAYYLKTNDYNESDESGTKIDLLNGLINSYSFKYNAPKAFGVNIIFLFKLRFNLATSGLDNPLKIREVRRQIARAKTELTQRQLNDKK